MPIVAPADYATLPKDLVLTGGCFDPLHRGHLAYFEAASAFGPVCCAVASDETILNMKGRPALFPQADRMALVAALPPVAYVVAADDSGDAGMLEDVRPKFYAKGQDWLDRLPEAELKACQQFGIPTLFLDGLPRESSSDRLRLWQQRMDDIAVEAFERIIQHQQPALTPWHPVTDYSVEARTAIEGRHPQLILDHLITGRSGEKILDYGCGPKAHLVGLLQLAAAKSSVYVYGYDPQLPSSEWMRSDTRSGWYDLVICREVLEHLMITSLCRVVADLIRLSSRLVYVTTRFCADPDHLLDVDEGDDLDPTHITMLTKPFLRTLFLLHGCTSRPDLEAQMDWQQKGRVLVFEVPHV